jgi:iron complex outermembrane receptor protein
VTVEGAEIELESQWNSGWRARISYAFADAKDEHHQWLNNSPRHIGKLQIIAPVYPKKVFLSFELQAISPRLNATQTREIDGYAVGNLTLFSREIVKNLEVTAGVYNLWNTKYSDPVSSDFLTDTVPQDRLNFQVKLTYKF